MRCFLTLSAFAAVLFLAQPVKANPHNGGGQTSHGNTHEGGHDKNFKHDIKGALYGRDHHDWSYRYYWSKYGCNCYYNPTYRSWYYWSTTYSCYCPVSYIETYPPVVEVKIFTPQPIVVPPPVVEVKVVTPRPIVVPPPVVEVKVATPRPVVVPPPVTEVKVVTPQPIVGPPQPAVKVGVETAGLPTTGPDGSPLK